MITVIRERLLNNKIYKYVIWILVATLIILWSAPGRKNAGDYWAATINGTEIDGREFIRKVREKEQLLQDFRRQMGPQADIILQSIDPKALALDTLISEELLNQAAAAIPVYVDDEYIRAKLADPMFVYQVLQGIVPQQVIDPENGINGAYLKAYLRQTGSSMGEFETKIKEALQRYVLEQILSTAWYIPEFEARDYYVANQVGKNFSVLTLSLADYLKKAKESKVPEQELEKFYHKQSGSRRYWVPEKRTGRVWKFDSAAYGTAVSEADAQAYYEENKSTQFLDKPAQMEVRRMVFKVSPEQPEQEAHKKAKAAREEVLANPALFATKGELLPAFGKGSHEEAFDRAAFLLKQDGDISDVIATKNGFEVIQRVSKKAPSFKPFKSVSQNIQSELAKRQFLQQFGSDMQQILEKGKDQEADFKAFAQEHGATVKEYASVEKGQGGVAQALFSLKDNNEMTFYAENGNGYVAQLTGIEKAYQPSLEAIKDAVTNDFYKDQAVKALQEDGKKAQTEAATKSFAQLSSEFGLNLKQTGMFKATDAEKTKSLKSQGLPVDQMATIEKVGAVIALQQGDNAYLVRLDAIEPFNEADFTAKMPEIMQQLTRDRLEALFRGFVASLYRNATIKANEALFSSINESQKQEIPDYEN